MKIKDKEKIKVKALTLLEERKKEPLAYFLAKTIVARN